MEKETDSLMKNRTREKTGWKLWEWVVQGNGLVVFYKCQKQTGPNQIHLTCCSLIPHGVPWAPWHSHSLLRDPSSTAAGDIRNRAGCLRKFRYTGVS